MSWGCRSCTPKIGRANSQQGLCPEHVAAFLGTLRDLESDLESCRKARNRDYDRYVQELEEYRRKLMIFTRRREEREREYASRKRGE